MTEPHERLDRALDARRIELDMTWADLASHARIAEVTLRAIRAGRNHPSALTKHRLEQAVQWPSGSIDAILAGRDVPDAPEPVREHTDPVEDLRSLDAQLDQVAKVVDDLQRQVRSAISRYSA